MPHSHGSWPGVVASVPVFIPRRGMSVSGLCWSVGVGCGLSCALVADSNSLASGVSVPLPHRRADHVPSQPREEIPRTCLPRSPDRLSSVPRAGAMLWEPRPPIFPGGVPTSLSRRNPCFRDPSSTLLYPRSLLSRGACFQTCFFCSSLGLLGGQTHVCDITRAFVRPASLA